MTEEPAETIAPSEAAPVSRLHSPSVQALSAAIGLLAGQMVAAELARRDWQSPPRTTALGALLSHVTGDAVAETYQPMNVNFGLFPPLASAPAKGRPGEDRDRKSTRLNSSH